MSTFTAVHTENQISFPRQKPRWWSLSAAYRGLRLARWLCGDRAVLRWLLQWQWIAWRLSFETAGGLYGDAWCNETFCCSDDVLKRWIPAGGSVLDIGCGGGRLSQLAGQYAGRVVGIDYQPASLARARALNRFPHVEYRLVDVSTLPQERFDLAILVAVLEHIDDVDSLLLQISRVAKRLVIEVPDFYADDFGLARQDLGCVWWTDADHVREYTQPILAQHLARNQWTALEWSHRGRNMLVVAESAHA